MSECRSCGAGWLRRAHAPWCPNTPENELAQLIWEQAIDMRYGHRIHHPVGVDGLDNGWATGLINHQTTKKRSNIHEYQ